MMKPLTLDVVEFVASSPVLKKVKEERQKYVDKARQGTPMLVRPAPFMFLAMVQALLDEDIGQPNKE
eukprot:7676341-Alexandrium_andersonii.AAC.1